MGYYDPDGRYHPEAFDQPQTNNVGSNDDQFKPGELGGTDYGAGDSRKPAYEGSGFTPNPRIGVDNRPWTDLYSVSSTEYGGHAGGAEEEQNRYAGLAGAADNRAAPQADLSAFNQDTGFGSQGMNHYRTVQGGLARRPDPNALAGSGYQDWAANYYKGVLAGNQTPAQLQMQQGMRAGLGQTASQVAGARGGGNALAAAQSAGADAGARQTGAYQGGLARLRAQEYAGAVRGLGDVASQRRQQDLQASGMQADAAFKQAQLEAQQRAANDARNIDLERQRRDVFQNQLAGQQFGEKTQLQTENEQAQANERAEQKRQEQKERDINTIVSTGSTVLGFAKGSDVRLKKDIKPADMQVDAAMDQMTPYGYHYKQPGKYGKGEQVGPMAQDLAATPAGRTAVTKLPDGKLGIDVGQGTKLSLAGIARLNERMRQLEANHPVAVPQARDFAGAGAGGMLSGAYHANPNLVHDVAKDAAVDSAGLSGMGVDVLRRHPELARELATDSQGISGIGADMMERRPEVRNAAKSYMFGGLPSAAASYLRGSR